MKKMGRSLDDYYKSKMFEGPIANKELNGIYNLIEEVVKFKGSCLIDKYEDLEISTGAIFNWEEGFCELIYNPESDSEQEQAYNDIYKCFFIVNSEYENVVFLIYSQLEAILKHRIKIKGKKNDYNKFKKAETQKGIRGGLILLYRYNVEIGYIENPYIEEFQDFMALMEDIVNELNDEFRKRRNMIAHDLIRIPQMAEIQKILDHGKNIELLIREVINSYIEMFNELLVNFKLSLKSFNEIFDITFEDKNILC